MSKRPGAIDPVSLNIHWTRLVSMVDEASATFRRTCFSTLVREANDFAVILTDAEGRAAPVISRIVNVVDTTGPVISLVGGDTVEVLKGATYTDPGVTATDNLDTDPADRIVDSTPPLPVDGLVLRFTFDDAANPLVDDISNKAITPQGEVTVTADGLGFGPGSGKGEKVR